MILQKQNGEKWERLVSAALMRVVHMDRWSIATETTGLSDQGEQIAFRVVMSRDEVAELTSAALQPQP